MGGFFGPDAKPEHNILSDVAAARTVFEAGMPMVVSGLETTTRFRVESDGIEAIRAAGPYGTALAREIDTWIEFKGRTWTTPHDPITALSMLRPDLYTFERGHVTVEDDGLTVFHADPAGPVRSRHRRRPAGRGRGDRRPHRPRRGRSGRLSRRWLDGTACFM